MATRPRLAGHVGANRDPLPGAAALRKGSYTLTLVADSAGGGSPVVTVDFKVR
jgi:hypothetical protein